MRMENLPPHTLPPTSQAGKWSRTGKQETEPHHLEFPLLTGVGGGHGDESETLWLML